MSNVHKSKHKTQIEPDSEQLKLENQQEKLKEEQSQIDLNIQSGPPKTVVVFGSKQVGKSTLIQSICKHQTKSKLGNINGNVTFRTSKHSRITLVEAPTQILPILDLCKVADLALFLVDINVGFEMELFETVSVLKTHGFPNVMGILTHLDTVKDGKAVKKMRKRMKDRFWKEVQHGCKFFHLSGVEFDGLQKKTEIINVCRQIGHTKHADLSWRRNHSFIIADKHDQKEVEDQNANKSSNSKKTDSKWLYSFQGWVKGADFNHTLNRNVHIPGQGDFEVDSVQPMEDPCPTLKGVDRGSGKGRNLVDKDRVAFAPLCDNVSSGSRIAVSNLGLNGSVQLRIPDKNNVLSKDQVDETEIPDGIRMIKNMQSYTDPNNKEKENHEQLNRIEDAQKFNHKVEDQSDNAQDNLNFSTGWEMNDFSNDQNKVIFKPKIDKIKQNEEKAHTTQNEFEERLKNLKNSTDDFQNLIYDSEDIYYTSLVNNQLSDQKKNYKFLNVFFGNKEQLKKIKEHELQNQDDSKDLKILKNSEKEKVKKVDKKISNQKQASKKSKINNIEEENENSDDQKDDEMEENDENSASGSNSEENSNNGEEVSDHSENESEIDEDATEKNKDEPEESEEESEKEDDKNSMENQKLEDDNKDKKKASIRKQIEKMQVSLKNFNKANPLFAFDGQAMKGQQVKINLIVKSKLNMDEKHKQPIILCQLTSIEDKLGQMKIKIIKNRFQERLLKSRDPLVFSVGWRRFQSVPVYFAADDEKRARFLKQTPGNLHCMALVQGPIVPIHAGILGVQQISEEHKEFRVSCNGVVVELNVNFNVQKKLKLVGEPDTINKNTAIIRNMFNSDLEVTRFLKARIQTVSGIRGVVKKPQGNLGLFRASFEDKLVMSDLVFLKSWVDVPVPKFYVSADSEKTSLLRSIYEIKQELGIKNNIKQDSIYSTVQRAEDRHFSKMKLPQKVFDNQSQLDSVNKHKLLEENKKIPDAIPELKSDKEKEIDDYFMKLNRIKTHHDLKRKRGFEEHLKNVEVKELRNLKGFGNSLRKLKSVKELKKIDTIRKANIEYQEIQRKDKMKRMSLANKAKAGKGKGNGRKNHLKSNPNKDFKKSKGRDSGADM